MTKKQFGLRFLLVLLTVLAAVFAIYSWLQPSRYRQSLIEYIRARDDLVLGDINFGNSYPEFSRCPIEVVEAVAIDAAVANEDFDKVRWLLEVQKVDPNCVDAYGVSLIARAAQQGMVGMVDLLIKNNADPNLKDRIGRDAVDWTNARLRQAKETQSKTELEKVIRLEKVLRLLTDRINKGDP